MVNSPNHSGSRWSEGDGGGGGGDANVSFKGGGGGYPCCLSLKVLDKKHFILKTIFKGFILEKGSRNL